MYICQLLQHCSNAGAGSPYYLFWLVHCMIQRQGLNWNGRNHFSDQSHSWVWGTLRMWHFMPSYPWHKKHSIWVICGHPPEPLHLNWLYWPVRWVGFPNAQSFHEPMHLRMHEVVILLSQGIVIVLFLLCVQGTRRKEWSSWDQDEVASTSSNALTNRNTMSLWLGMSPIVDHSQWWGVLMFEIML